MLFEVEMDRSRQGVVARDLSCSLEGTCRFAAKSETSSGWLIRRARRTRLSRRAWSVQPVATRELSGSRISQLSPDLHEKFPLCRLIVPSGGPKCRTSGGLGRMPDASSLRCDPNKHGTEYARSRTQSQVPQDQKRESECARMPFSSDRRRSSGCALVLLSLRRAQV